MRLLERTRIAVRIVPRKSARDADGAVYEAFDTDDAISARGSLAPVGNTLGYTANGLSSEAYGVRAARARKLLLPRATPIVEGDGVLFAGETQVQWVCVSVDAWSGHVEARLEKRA